MMQLKCRIHFAPNHLTNFVSMKHPPYGLSSLHRNFKVDTTNSTKFHKKSSNVFFSPPQKTWAIFTTSKPWRFRALRHSMILNHHLPGLTNPGSRWYLWSRRRTGLDHHRLHRLHGWEIVVFHHGGWLEICFNGHKDITRFMDGWPSRIWIFNHFLGKSAKTTPLGSVDHDSCCEFCLLFFDGLRFYGVEKGTPLFFGTKVSVKSMKSGWFCLNNAYGYPMNHQNFCWLCWSFP